MPLHLLGKKSWNVYNQDNVARVRQDEAAARLAEQKAESTQQQEDARQRLKLLRGEQEDTHSTQKEVATAVNVRDRKRKRGQDDIIQQPSSGGHRDLERGRISSAPEKWSDNNDLGEEKSPSGSNQKNARKADMGIGEDLDNISNMKFKDAAGRHADSRGPWYAQNSTRENRDPGKDVWGNEDPGRKVRNEQRIIADDPLLAMKKGVKKLRESERHRKEWMEQRERDLYEVEELARRHKRHRRKHHHDGHRNKPRHERRYS